MMHRLIFLALLLPFGAGAQTYKEGEAFSLAAPTWVLYGDVSTDRLTVRKMVAGQRKCVVGPSNFDGDPAPGAAKTCTVNGTRGLIAEGQQFTLPAGGVIWYGNGAKFRTRTLPAGNASWTCDNATMGGDPAYGVGKFCRATAYTDSLACWPKQLGGSGTWAAWGLVVSPSATAWAGWLCPDKSVQAVGCVAEGCKPDVFKRAVSTTDLAAANVALQGARTAHVDKGPVAELISSHWAEIVATRP
jgi:hypothetical protein